MHFQNAIETSLLNNLTTTLSKNTNCENRCDGNFLFIFGEFVKNIGDINNEAAEDKQEETHATRSGTIISH